MTHQTRDHASKKKLCVDVSESLGLTIGTVGNYSRGNSKNQPYNFWNTYGDYTPIQSGYLKNLHI
jgi:hypothetical protein